MMIPIKFSFVDFIRVCSMELTVCSLLTYSLFFLISIVGQIVRLKKLKQPAPKFSSEGTVPQKVSLVVSETTNTLDSKL